MGKPVIHIPNAIDQALVVTASVSGNEITFTKTDASTFPIIVDTGSHTDISALNSFTSSYYIDSASFSGSIAELETWSSSLSFTSDTSSLLVTASINLNEITFTKGDGSQFPIVVDTGSQSDISALNSFTSSYYIDSASFSSSISELETWSSSFQETQGLSSVLAISNETNNNDIVVSSNDIIDFRGNNVTTMLFSGSEDIAYGDGELVFRDFQSLIFQSGSGTGATDMVSIRKLTPVSADILIGSTNVDGKLSIFSGNNSITYTSPSYTANRLINLPNSNITWTGSADGQVMGFNSSANTWEPKTLVFTDISALNSFTSSYYIDSASFSSSISELETWSGSLSFTSDTSSLLVTASVSSNTITFTKGNGSTFPITIDTGSGLQNVVEDLTPQLGGNLDGTNKTITNISSISSAAALFGVTPANLRAFNVRGTGLNGRLSIQGGIGDQPGIEMTIDDNASRVLLRMDRSGTDGTRLEIYVEPDGGAISKSVVIDEDNAFYINPDAANANFTPNAGFRNNSGVMQYKNASGDWTNIPPTSSLLVTASISSNTITFTKGDGSTFPIVVPTGTATDITALNNFTASYYIDSASFSGSIAELETWSSSLSLTVPTASSTEFGTVKVLSDTIQTIAANSVTSTAARTYGIQKNTSGQTVVNVPWANTTYSTISDANLSNSVSTTAGLITGQRINTWANTRGLTTTAISNWNTAYSWGDHSVEGYLTSANTASLLVTASINLNEITFTKGDGSQFPIVVDTGSTVPYNYVFDIGVSSNDIITTGAKGRKVISIDGTILGWKLVADVSSTITLDIWKANATIPTNANSITAAAKPTLTAAQFNQSTTLTGWSTSVANGDVIILEVEANNNAKYIMLQLLISAE